MGRTPSKEGEVRRQATASKSDRLDAEVRLYQQQRWDAETAKIARLRALRLARDANMQNTKEPGNSGRTRAKATSSRA